MRAVPLDVLLSFPVPNYVDPPTRGPALAVVNIIFIALVVAAVSLRVYTRLFVNRWFGSDDIFIVLALVSSVLRSVETLRTGKSVTTQALELTSVASCRPSVSALQSFSQISGMAGIDTSGTYRSPFFRVSHPTRSASTCSLSHCVAMANFAC